MSIPGRAIVLFVGASGALVACGNSSSAPLGLGCVNGPIVSITPPTATLHLGDSLRLRALAPANLCGTTTQAPDTTHFKWAVVDTAVARVDSLSGMVVARRGGSTTVEAVWIPSLDAGSMILTVSVP